MVESKHILFAGGHRDSFECAGKILRKKTKKEEFDNYNKIFDDSEQAKTDPRYEEHVQFRKFLPPFYGTEEREIEGKPLFFVALGNLTNGMNDYSILDVKMGQTTLTRTNSEAERIKMKDRESTTEELGFRVTAEVLKSETGELLYNKKKHYLSIKKEDLPGIFRNFLNSSMEEQTLKTPEVRDFYVKRIEEMMDFFANKQSRQIIGSSLLFLLDPTSKKPELKIIDLADFTDYDSLDSRDEGYLLGLRSLRQILAAL